MQKTLPLELAVSIAKRLAKANVPFCLEFEGGKMAMLDARHEAVELAIRQEKQALIDRVNRLF